MPTQVTNYQCPACTGPLHFSAESGKLECEFCGSVFETAEIEALYAEKDREAAEASATAAEKSGTTEAAGERSGGEAWDYSAIGGDWGADADGMKAYSCPSCGAELVCDATTAATSCPYCGNPTIVPGQFSGMMKPDWILPFRLEKDAAVAALKKHYRRKLLLPSSFKKTNHIEEIRGIYVPFWLFDADADADVSFHATRTHSHREGDYEVTVTEHYNVRRSGTVAFRAIPTDASSKMPDEHMDSIEPFDYSEFKDFSAAYLPGYLADKYDVSAEDCAQRADERCENSAVQVMADDVVGYGSVTPVQKNVRLYRGQVHYALLPVWLLNTKWKGKDFLFAMNGQTGRLVGDLPISRARFWGIFAGLSVLLSALLALTGAGGLLAGMLG